MVLFTGTRDECEAYRLSRLPAIREAARDCGYAIGLHGSQRRDFDLIAVPWVADVQPKNRLAAAIQLAACGFKQERYDWEEKPHWRSATAFPVCCTEWHDMISAGHIDLWILDTPLITRAAPAPGTDESRVEHVARMLMVGVELGRLPGEWMREADPVEDVRHGNDSLEAREAREAREAAELADKTVKVKENPITTYYVVCPVCDECHAGDGSMAGDRIECICGTTLEVES